MGSMPDHTPERPRIPEGVANTLRLGAVGLVVVAALGNIGHTYEAAHDHGQPVVMAAVIAALPDVMLVLCVLRLRYDRRSAWAWLGLAASTLFVGWASILTTGDRLGERIFALAPLVAAIISAGLLEHQAEAAEGEAARVAPEAEGLGEVEVVAAAAAPDLADLSSPLTSDLSSAPVLADLDEPVPAVLAVLTPDLAPDLSLSRTPVLAERGKTGPVLQASLTDDEDLAALKTAVAEGHLPTMPSRDAVRSHLSISTSRAAAALKSYKTEIQTSHETT